MYWQVQYFVFVNAKFLNGIPMYCYIIWHIATRFTSLYFTLKNYYFKFIKTHVHATLLQFISPAVEQRSGEEQTAKTAFWAPMPEINCLIVINATMIMAWESEMERWKSAQLSMRICLYYLGTRGEESVAGRIYDVEQVFIAINVVRTRYLWRQFTNGVNLRQKAQLQRAQ